MIWILDNPYADDGPWTTPEENTTLDIAETKKRSTMESFHHELTDKKRILLEVLETPSVYLLMSNFKVQLELSLE